MKIAFDGKRAIQNFTGLGNYSRLLISLLCQHAPQHEYHLYAPNRKDEHPRIQHFFNESPRLYCHYPDNYWHYQKSVWRSWGICRQLEKDHIELYHGLSGELPLNISSCAGIKKVVTIHDLIFEHFPQYYKPIDRTIYSLKFRKACQDADKVIAICECTKRDLMRLYHVPEEKIQVVYQGCDPSFSIPVTTEEKEKIRKSYHLPEKFILNVGTIEERKNVLLIVQALKNIPEDIHLIILGRETPYTLKVKAIAHKLGVGHRIRMMQNIPFPHLPAFYQMAQVFIYPSRYEGFGIPILEALSGGTPVIGATGSCLEEAGGPHSIYVHPDDVSSMEKAILMVLEDERKREEMVREGKVWAGRFSEQKQISDILHLYQSI